MKCERSFILCPILFPQELQQSPMLRKRLAAERRRTLIGDDVGVQHFFTNVGKQLCQRFILALLGKKKMEVNRAEHKIYPVVSAVRQLSLRNDIFQPLQPGAFKSILYQ